MGFLVRHAMLERTDIASFCHSGLPRDCISPIVVTHPDLESYPGIASGTGFFVRRERDVYFLTALHALENKGTSLNFERTAQMLTIPFYTTGTTRKDHDYVRFDRAIRLAEDPLHSSFVDVVSLKVKKEGKGSRHKHLLSRAAKLPPTGQWLNQFVKTDLVSKAMAANEPITFVVIGYPNEGTATGIDYPDVLGALPEITLQPAQFIGHLRPSSLDYCLKLEDISWTRNLAGFSGSPVFVQFKTSHGKQSALAGMLVRGGEGTTHFIAISTLVKAAGDRK